MENEIKKSIDIIKNQKQELINKISKNELSNEAKIEIINRITILDETIEKYYMKLKKSKII